MIRVEVNRTKLQNIVSVCIDANGVNIKQKYDGEIIEQTFSLFDVDTIVSIDTDGNDRLKRERDKIERDAEGGNGDDSKGKTKSKN